MTNPIIPVVLCGGSGTRLWPLSRSGFPKQFLVLSGNSSLFQQAIQRMGKLAAGDIRVADPIVVTNEAHRFLALEQLREIRQSQARLMLEPAGRNTAPALTLAALQAIELGGDPILAVIPADQLIADQDKFSQAMQAAVRAAADDSIVVLGIEASRPETGYGYIKIPEGVPAPVPVERFVEKPDLATAERYLAEGGYFWNAGIVVVKASRWLAALGTYRPDILDATNTAWQGRAHEGNFTRPDAAAFTAIPAESVDYAVIERCPGSPFPIRMVPLDAGWNDLGAWDAVWSTQARDERGNACTGDVLLNDARNSLVHASYRLVGVIGVDNLVVIETPDAVLVADKSRCQDVGHIVAALRERGREEHVLHRKVHRPWGWYDSIDEEERFKVKRILVKPGACLSLQKHHHRAEHWIVVKGTAEITCGDKVLLLTENQSTYIPLGEVHRLANPGTIPLEVIEVQSGSYLGEDDIVRFEDNYGRSFS
jgi:mannose-1-phosphate guanylyltransferase/mannose-6-phosphate isomerase